MNEQAVRFRLGIFVLASLILLGVLTILFGGTPTFFQTSNRYFIKFDDATGISQGTPVRRSGVKIGEVENVKLDEESPRKVVVTIRVDPKFPIYKNEEPIVKQSVLGGDASIDFVPIPPPPPPPQPQDKTVVPPGSTIQGKNPVGAQEMLQQVGKLVQPTEEAMKEVKKFFTRLDKMTPLMEDTMREYRDLARTARELAPAVRDTNKELQELIKFTRANVPDLKRTNEEIQVTSRTWTKLGERLNVLLQTNEKKLVQSLEALEDTLKQMNKAFSEQNQKNLTDTLENVAGASKQLDSIARNTDALLRDSRKTINRVTDSVDRADKILKNLEDVTGPMAARSGKILKNLDEATAELNRAMADVRALMGAVGKSEGTLSKLLTDPSLYNRLDEAACAVNRVLPRLDHILRDVEIFSDRIARHPELLGVGGAVSPSSGLKDLPGRPSWQK